MYRINTPSTPRNIIAGLLFLMASFLVGVTSVWAMPTTELDGYAWSSNIGWISLNCKTGSASGTDICGTSNYKVSISASGSIRGYAWSSNVGWIKFDGLSSFPSGAGTSAVDSQVTGTYPILSFTGWARACSGTAAGDCSSMTSRTDGWDGWISLKGTGYGVNTDSSGVSPNSYVWGSDVVGWIDMSTNVNWLKPTATLTVGTCTVPIGATGCDAPVTWDIQNAASPNVRNSSSNVSYGNVATGTAVMKPLLLGSNNVHARDNIDILTTVSVTLGSASCASGGVVVAGATSTTCELPPPSVSISLDKTIIRSGDTVTATWSTNPSPIVSGTCSLRGPGLSGSVTGSGTRSSSVLTSKTRFSILCDGPFGHVESSSEVEVIPVAKEV